jgi:hypothetical protein
MSVKPAYATNLGRMYHGKCEEILNQQPIRRRRGAFQLLFTSPPFPLNRKKRYGNKQGEEYLDWLTSLAPLFRDQVVDDGSIVIEIGNAWEPGSPTTSTLPMKALLAFQEAAGLHLCQEFICYNPAKLPTPAEWVTVRRIRVKDAFTRVWWMSPSEYPKADNRRVLTEYSSSMKQLLNRGTYNSGDRPSEHRIGEKSFLSNNGGAIPPNVIVPKPEEDDPLNLLPIANTASSDPYLKYCREQGIRPHPARMPPRLLPQTKKHFKAHMQLHSAYQLHLAPVQRNPLQVGIKYDIVRNDDGTLAFCQMQKD